MFLENWKKELFTVPNLLSLLRLVLLPVYLGAYLRSKYLTAGGILLLSCLTDLLDGFLARKLHQVTDLGKVLDPLADKLLTLAAMTMFCQWGAFPAWALMVVLAREFAVSGLRMVAGPKGKVIAAGWSGKVKTAATMVGLCVWMAFPQNVIIGWIVCGVIVATTLYSGVEYFVQNWKCLWDE